MKYKDSGYTHGLLITWLHSLSVQERHSSYEPKLCHSKTALFTASSRSSQKLIIAQLTYNLTVFPETKMLINLFKATLHQCPHFARGIQSTPSDLTVSQVVPSLNILILQFCLHFSSSTCLHPPWFSTHCTTFHILIRSVVRSVFSAPINHSVNYMHNMLYN